MQKIHKKFGSHNGFLTQSMNHSEDTKIKTISMMKQRKVPRRSKAALLLWFILIVNVHPLSVGLELIVHFI